MSEQRSLSTSTALSAFRAAVSVFLTHFSEQINKYAYWSNRFMTLNEVFTEMYSSCEQDWIAIQLQQQCLPSWVYRNGTYDYQQAEVQRACEMPESQFNQWCKFTSQYMGLARRRYAIHLKKLKLVIERQNHQNHPI